MLLVVDRAAGWPFPSSFIRLERSIVSAFYRVPPFSAEVPHSAVVCRLRRVWLFGVPASVYTLPLYCRVLVNEAADAGCSSRAIVVYAQFFVVVLAQSSAPNVK